MKKFIILFLCLLTFNSCRVVKKEWVKENFTEKSTTQKINVIQDSIFSSEISKLETSVSKLETSVSNTETTSTSSSENESTTISGSIIAEDGKEKSVTVGGTTIKSNGANVTFETTSTKAINKAFERQFEELSTKLQEERKTNETLKTEMSSLKSEFANFVSTYESEKTTQSKTVKKSGLGFGFWLTLILIAIVISIVWYFRKSIPFLK